MCSRHLLGVRRHQLHTLFHWAFPQRDWWRRRWRLQQLCGGAICRDRASSGLCWRMWRWPLCSYSLVMLAGLARRHERRLRPCLHIPDRQARFLDLWLVLVAHARSLQRNWHASSLRPSELLQDRCERAVHRADASLGVPSASHHGQLCAVGLWRDCIEVGWPVLVYGCCEWRSCVVQHPGEHACVEAAVAGIPLRCGAQPIGGLSLVLEPIRRRRRWNWPCALNAWIGPGVECSA